MKDKLVTKDLVLLPCDCLIDSKNEYRPSFLYPTSLFVVKFYDETTMRCLGLMDVQLHITLRFMRQTSIKYEPGQIAGSLQDFILLIGHDAPFIVDKTDCRDINIFLVFR